MDTMRKFEPCKTCVLSDLAVAQIVTQKNDCETCYNGLQRNEKNQDIIIKYKM